LSTCTTSIKRIAQDIRYAANASSLAALCPAMAPAMRVAPRVAEALKAYRPNATESGFKVYDCYRPQVPRDGELGT
jgi:D-alanyl-D-alanine dipeptidase